MSMDNEDLKAIQKLFRKELKVEMEPIKETLGANTESLINIEKEIKAYMDALGVERKRIDKHDSRLEIIEESLNLNP